jgi:FKBP-type peptidyl-prolyl cis-trans isomerase FkpA
MKKKYMSVLCIAVGMLCCCKAAETNSAENDSPLSKPLDADTSYAFGMALSSQFKDMKLTFDYDAFTRGFREYLEDKQTKFSLDEAIARANTVYNEALEAQTEVSRQEELAYLAENSKKPGVNTTASGLQYEVITEGTGPKPAAEDIVRVNYEGTLIDGTVFDSSYTRGEPAEFGLNRVIRGWTEGIQLMNEGSTYRFYIPSELGYGEQGAGSMIPPYATLIFKVELLSITKL